MTSKKKKTDPQTSQVISLHGAGSKAPTLPIKSPTDFLRFAESLVAFEKRREVRSIDSDQPAPRVTSLDGFAGKGSTIRLQTTAPVAEDESSPVTPFPQSMGKPPSPGTT